jgi:hypothetical protein
MHDITNPVRSTPHSRPGPGVPGDRDSYLLAAVFHLGQAKVLLRRAAAEVIDESRVRQLHNGGGVQYLVESIDLLFAATTGGR